MNKLLKRNIKWTKRIIAAILVSVLITGGVVAAHITITTTAKYKYFQAESNSIQFIKQIIKDKYKPEIKWLNLTKEKPTKSIYTLSPTYEEISENSSIFNPNTFINHSTFIVETEKDLINKKFTTDITANMGAIDIGSISFSVTDEKIMLRLPFSQEVLLVEEKDIGNILHYMNKHTDLNNTVDLGSLFDGTKLNNKLSGYIEQYIHMIYEELPEEAFRSSEDTVELRNDSVHAEKIEFHLSEVEIKNLLSLLINKLNKDGTLKEILQNFLIEQIGFGLSVTPLPPEVNNEIKEIMENFDDILHDANNSLEFLSFQNGINSTIWIHKGLIIKRDIKFSIAEEGRDLLDVHLEGTQLLDDQTQFFDYHIYSSLLNTDHIVNVHALSTKEGDQFNESVILSFANSEISYKGEDTLSDTQREFKRTVTFKDDTNDPISLLWHGNATYDRDHMQSDHLFSVDSVSETIETLELQMSKTSELIKNITISEDNTRNLGTLNETEFAEFMNHEIIEKFEQWIFGNIGGGLFGP